MRIGPDEFARIGAASTPVFSRDGRTLFHLRGAGLPQVWALDLQSDAARQLTFHDEKVALLRRCPTDDRLIYGIDRGGDERQQLLLIDPAEERPVPRAVTDDPDVLHGWGAFAPDGTRLAYTANARDIAHFDVHLYAIADGTRSRVHEGEGLLKVFGFRPDGTVLAMVRDRAYGDMSLLLLDLGTGEAHAFPQPTGTNYDSLRWTSDGQTLLALTDHGGSEFMRLCRLDPGSAEVTVVHEAPGRDVEAWAASADGAMLATVENDRGDSVLRVGPTDGARPVVPGLPHGVISEPAFDPDGTSLAFTLTGSTVPASIWMWRDGAIARLVTADSAVDPARFVGLELVEWQSFDGMRIPGWFALPPGPVPRTGHPAVIWVHGGPVGQTRPNFRPDIQMLLHQGIAVLMPNVRGSSGYGRTYVESDDVDKRLDSVADLAHGRHWLAAHPAIDGDRIGIMGQSYGGFMVNSAITEYPDLWSAAVSYYGIADFVTMLEETGPWRRDHRAAEYGDPVRHAALFARISPIHRVDRVQAPVLLAHGTRDPRVPYGESVRFATALAQRQKKVEFLTFDYAGHGFVRPDDRARIYGAVAEFFRTHLATDGR
jgi:dipeptidyl aminopeptidase/acylaminoacyl peptidase